MIIPCFLQLIATRRLPLPSHLRDLVQAMHPTLQDLRAQHSHVDGAAHGCELYVGEALFVEQLQGVLNVGSHPAAPHYPDLVLRVTDEAAAAAASRSRVGIPGMVSFR
eukprot:1137908-Pelagomonas_calceolata.AAC.2